MKRLFTNLLKYQVMLLSVGFFMTGSINMSAEEYKSIFNYDRVWECRELTDYGRWELKYIKFDGEEEINGKTYHRLTTFMRIEPGFNKTKNEYYPYRMETDLHEHEGYIREENGVMYVPVIAEKGFKIDYDINHFDLDHFYVRIRKYTPDSDPLTTEDCIMDIPIFDYNRTVGDTFFCIDYSDTNIFDAGVFPFRIVRENQVEVDGEICREFTFQAYNPEIELENPHDYHFKTVEGIGMVCSFGTLNYQTMRGMQSTGIYCHNSFQRLLNSDGNVLYESEDVTYPGFNVPGLSSVNTINREAYTNTPLYDMMGRHISSPAPGQLYIRDGKKYIGK